MNVYVLRFLYCLTVRVFSISRNYACRFGCGRLWTHVRPKKRTYTSRCVSYHVMPGVAADN